MDERSTVNEVTAAHVLQFWLLASKCITSNTRDAISVIRENLKDENGADRSLRFTLIIGAITYKVSGVETVALIISYD